MDAETVATAPDMIGDLLVLTVTENPVRSPATATASAMSAGQSGFGVPAAFGALVALVTAARTR